ncbi:unnamed protein product, partial [Ranitomeya imitator]
EPVFLPDPPCCDSVLLEEQEVSAKLKVEIEGFVIVGRVCGVVIGSSSGFSGSGRSKCLILLTM